MKPRPLAVIRNRRLNSVALLDPLRSVQFSPIGEDPAAHGHWCAFTDLYHTIPYHVHMCVSYWPTLCRVFPCPRLHY